MAKDLQLVVFQTGKEFYGVPIHHVYEIVKAPEVTAVPDAPPSLQGVINLRGKIIPVIDLRRRLRLPETERTKAARILIIEINGKRAGLLVDSVSEVLKVAPDAVEAPPEMILSVGIEYITGVVKSGTRLIILIELGKVMSAEEMKKIGTASSHIEAVA